MKITHLLLSASLILTTFAGSMAVGVSSASARDGYRGHGGGNQHSRGHHSPRREYRGNRHSNSNQHRGGHNNHRRGHNNNHRGSRGGAFATGAALGLILGWSGGYGYPQAHHNRYRQHHQPYYAPRRSNSSYYGHTQRHYAYSDGYYDNNQGYQSHGSRGCHPVYKFGRWNGRPAKVGGTMCYNSRGNGYVVDNSRYLIHYR